MALLRRFRPDPRVKPVQAHELPLLATVPGASIGSVIHAIRVRSGMPALTFAAAIGISRPQLTNIERGRRRPRLATVYRLSAHYGHDLDVLLSRWLQDELAIDLPSKVVRVTDR